MPTKQPPRDRGTLAHLRGLIPDRSLLPSEALRIAELQAARLRTALKTPLPEFPIEAISAMPKIEVNYASDLPSSGMTYWDGSAWRITLNALESPARQRFSLVHEYKHIVDHNAVHKLYGTDRALAERAADYFAACVLMPKMLIKRHWGQGPRDSATMADQFGVSPTAMRYRLDQLGLTEPMKRCRGYRKFATQEQEIAA